MKFTALGILALAFSLAVPPAHAAYYDDLPWVLRPYYEFTVREMQLRYAGDNAEWHLTAPTLGQLVNRAEMAVTFTDGTTLSTETFKKGSESRHRGTMPQGAGVHYSVTLPTDNGVEVEHSFFVNTNRPFYVVDVKITNTGATPLDIKSITPVVLPQDSFAALSPAAEYIERPLTTRSTWPLYDPNAGPLSVRLQDTTKNFIFLMGLLPKGEAESHPRMMKSAEGWRGEVVCEFDPPVHLEPGESVTADPVWLCFAIPDPAELELLFSWTHAEQPREHDVDDLIDAYCTTEPYASESAFMDVAAEWRSLGVQHAAVPIGWESRPGTLSGGGAGFPVNMSRVASQLRSAGSVPGLSVDPLASPTASDAYSLVSDDGTRWVNLSDPQGFAHAVENMQHVTGWGFDFFIVAQSTIPDVALREFGMTRKGADTLALEAMQAAAGSALVLPSAQAAIGNDLTAWQRADAATERMTDYEMAIGPVRLVVGEAVQYDAEVIDVVREYEGPIELVGGPKPAVARSIDSLFPRKGSQFRYANTEPRRETADASDDESREPREGKKLFQRFRGAFGG